MQIHQHPNIVLPCPINRPHKVSPLIPIPIDVTTVVVGPEHAASAVAVVWAEGPVAHLQYSCSSDVVLVREFVRTPTGIRTVLTPSSFNLAKSASVIQLVGSQIDISDQVPLAGSRMSAHLSQCFSRYVLLSSPSWSTCHRPHILYQSRPLCPQRHPLRHMRLTA